ncbi:hypothetical protein [Mycoplasma sp. 3686d]|uniref:hypothetical protein n=1 Tax=Mycoplasma sp. 3686d TaxID=2967300 RepID=UPI00211C64F5|nr:hypothetical protein [Mycoplasma sp. 3686d]UUM24726.1 hypothetical protein NPA12_03455 [Mycoplasma sp. 3686d]
MRKVGVVSYSLVLIYSIKIKGDFGKIFIKLCSKNIHINEQNILTKQIFINYHKLLPP